MMTRVIWTGGAGVKRHKVKSRSPAWPRWDGRGGEERRMRLREGKRKETMKAKARK